MRLLGETYWVEREVQETETAGGIALPDSEYDRISTYGIIDVGPGKRRDDGTFSKMSAQRGDRAIADFNRFNLYEVRDKIQRGFLQETGIVAVIPGPDHEDVLPLRDYLMVEMDRMTEVDAVSGATVMKGGGTVLHATSSVLGSEMRYREMAQRAMKEMSEIIHSKRYAEMIPEDREKTIYEYLDGLPRAVHPMLAELCTGKMEKERSWVAPYIHRDPVLCGFVTGAGPEAKSRFCVSDDGRGIQLPIRTGARVHIDSVHRCIGAVIRGARHWFIQSKYIAAVEV